MYYGPEIFKQARVLLDLMNNFENLEKSGELKSKIDKIKKSLDKFYKDYSVDVDQTIFNVLHNEFIVQMNNKNIPKNINILKTDEWSKSIYSKSIMTSKERMLKFLNFWDNISFIFINKHIIKFEARVFLQFFK